jgi:hypothetical protein
MLPLQILAACAGLAPVSWDEALGTAWDRWRGNAHQRATPGGPLHGMMRWSSLYRELELRRASLTVGSKSSTGLPEGSSRRICLPPTPVTMSLRK